MDENSAKLPTIFDMETVILEQDRRGAAGNTCIGQLQVVSGAAASTNKEWRLGDAHGTTRTIGINDFQTCFADKDVGHQDGSEAGIVTQVGGSRRIDRCAAKQP